MIKHVNVNANIIVNAKKIKVRILVDVFLRMVSIKKSIFVLLYQQEWHIL